MVLVCDLGKVFSAENRWGIADKGRERQTPLAGEYPLKMAANKAQLSNSELVAILLYIWFQQQLFEIIFFRALYFTWYA